MRSVADDYNLDPEMIITSGSSAGAVTALFMAYAVEAQYEGDSGNPGWPSNPNAVISFSGELKSQGYCKSIDPRPRGCTTDTGDDFTDDIGKSRD